MSKTADVNLWGIHAGKTGDADSLFRKNNCVAEGWTKMGNLSATQTRPRYLQDAGGKSVPGRKTRGDPQQRRTVVPLCPRDEAGLRGEDRWM
jgi:hypothetical protein